MTDDELLQIKDEGREIQDLEDELRELLEEREAEETPC
jgi:hypothetical protein